MEIGVSNLWNRFEIRILNLTGLSFKKQHEQKIMEIEF